MRIVELFPRFANTFFYVRESVCDTADPGTLQGEHVHLLAYEIVNGRCTRYWWCAAVTYLDGIHHSVFARKNRRVDPRSIMPGKPSADYVAESQTWVPPLGRPPKLLARLERSYKPRVIRPPRSDHTLLDGIDRPTAEADR